MADDLPSDDEDSKDEEEEVKKEETKQDKKKKKGKGGDDQGFIKCFIYLYNLIIFKNLSLYELFICVLLIDFWPLYYAP